MPTITVGDWEIYWCVLLLHLIKLAITKFMRSCLIFYFIFLTLLVFGSMNWGMHSQEHFPKEQVKKKSKKKKSGLFLSSESHILSLTFISAALFNLQSSPQSSAYLPLHTLSKKTEPFISLQNNYLRCACHWFLTPCDISISILDVTQWMNVVMIKIGNLLS